MIWESTLLKEGPIVEINIYPEEARIYYLRGKQKEVPCKKHIKALVDTGADHCLLDTSVIHDLGLKYRDSIRVRNSSGTRPCALYGTTLCLSAYEDHAFEFLAAIMDFEEGLPMQAIIGRDMLQYFNLSYKGGDRSFQLTPVMGEFYYNR